MEVKIQILVVAISTFVFSIFSLHIVESSEATEVKSFSFSEMMKRSNQSSIITEHEIGDNLSEKINAVIISIAFGYPYEDNRPDNIHEGKFILDPTIFPSIKRREVIGDEIIGQTNEQLIGKISSIASGAEIVIMSYMGHGAAKKEYWGYSFPYGAMSMPITKSCSNQLKKMVDLQDRYYSHMTPEEQESEVGQSLVIKFDEEMMPQAQQDKCLANNTFVDYKKLGSGLSGSDLIFFNGSCHSGATSSGLNASLLGHYLLVAAADESEVSYSFYDKNKMSAYARANVFTVKDSDTAFFSELERRANSSRACVLDRDGNHILTIEEYLSGFPQALSGGLLLANKRRSEVKSVAKERNILMKIANGYSDLTELFLEGVSHTQVDMVNSSAKANTFTVKILDSKQCPIIGSEFDRKALEQNEILLGKAINMANGSLPRKPTNMLNVLNAMANGPYK